MSKSERQKERDNTLVDWNILIDMITCKSLWQWTISKYLLDLALTQLIII